MTLGDIIEKIRTLFGGQTKDERKLEELKLKIAKLSDECAQLRKRNEAIQKEIDDKTALYRTETIDANKVMILKEIQTLQTEFKRIDGTFDEKNRTKEGLMALRTELERKISHQENGVSVDEIEIASTNRGEREKDFAEVGSALEGLEGKNSGKKGKGAKSTKDELADLEAAVFGKTKAAPTVKSRSEKVAAAETPVAAPEAAVKSAGKVTIPSV